MSDRILQVGVKVVLRNSEWKMLLLRRSEEKYGKTDGCWDIVGGRIDIGTPLLENLAREIREETGLEMTSVPKLIAAQDILRSPEKHVVRLTYIGTVDGEPVLDTAENTDYRWMSFEELRAEPDLDGYVKEILSAGLLTPGSWT